MSNPWIPPTNGRFWWIVDPQLFTQSLLFCANPSCHFLPIFFVCFMLYHYSSLFHIYYSYILFLYIYIYYIYIYIYIPMAMDNHPFIDDFPFKNLHLLGMPWDFTLIFRWFSGSQDPHSATMAALRGRLAPSSGRWDVGCNGTGPTARSTARWRRPWRGCPAVLPLTGNLNRKNWEIPRCLGWQHVTILHLTYLSVGGVGYIVEHWDIE